MKSVYRVLAYLIALEVAIQAAAVVFGIFGLFKWVDGGGTLDKAAFEEESLSFTGAVGFTIHFMNGMMLIPLLALILLIISFFAKVPGGAKWAGFVLLAVVAQVFLGLFAHEYPALGILHGVNALILFSLAVMAGMRVRKESPAATSTPAERERV